MSSVSNVLNIDGGAHQIPFANYDELFSWISAERAVWDWASPSSPHNIANVGGKLQDSFSNLHADIERYRANAAPFSETLRAVESYYSQNSWFIYSKGKDGVLINEIREIAGEDAAFAALGLSRGAILVNQISQASHLKGLVLYLLPDIRKPAEIAERLRNERNSYRASINSGASKIDRLIESLNARAEEQKQEFRSIVAKVIRANRNHNNTTIKNARLEVSEQVAKIEGVRETFLEFMKLKAPVEYWKGRAIEHKEKERNARNLLTMYFPCALILVLGVFGISGYVLTTQKIANQSALFIIGAGLATVAAIIFWVGRLISRLYLSQQHLRHVAEERAVMTETYLALSHEHAVSDQDKQIILAALFRPSSDGLVADDGAPNWTIPAILSSQNK